MNSPAGDQVQITVNPSSSSSSSSSNSNWNPWGKMKEMKRIGFVLIFGITVTFLLLYNYSHPFDSFSLISSSISRSDPSIFQASKNSTDEELEKILKEAATESKTVMNSTEEELEKILKGAATEDKTVIITTSNEAWAEPGSIMDVFLGSLKSGNDTNKLIQHLVIVSLDENAHVRCLGIHAHCYLLKAKRGENFSGEAYFMTPTYLEMMWTRIDFLSTVLHLGFNFVFTDADIVWFRDPFPQFYKDVDFQIACDFYYGNPDDRNNQPNGGFNYVRSNNRSIAFYKYWYASRLRFPDKHDQDVLNMIKFDPFIEKIGLKMKFLDTKYFGGFCEPSKDFNSVCTMHANCCYGLKNKVQDLRIIGEDWRRFILSTPNVKALSSFTWGAPKYCRH